jgi:hypothetical protein
MYNVENNMDFILFLNRILSEAQKVHKLFDSKNIDKVKMIEDFTLLFQSIAKN